MRDYRDTHDECKMCDQQFLGFTDADLFEHYKNRHNHISDELADKLGLDDTETVVCENCGREYVTYDGPCPYCTRTV